MNLKDALLNVYFDVKFKIQDTIDALRVKYWDWKHGVVGGYYDELVKPSEAPKKVRKKKAKSKKKKK